MSFFEKFMAPKMYRDSGDGGGGGEDADKKPDDGDKGQGALTISQEDTATLKAAGYSPDDFSSQKDLDNAITIAGKGAHFKGKADQLESEKKKAAREQVKQKRDLALTGLVKEDGSVDMEHAKTLQEQAGQAETLNKLLDGLLEHGHLNPNVADALASDGPEAVLVGLKWIPKTEPGSQEAFNKAVETKVAAQLKELGVNDSDRSNAGGKNKTGEGDGKDVAGLDGFGFHPTNDSVTDFLEATKPK